MDTTMLFTSDVALMQRMTAVEESRNENRKKEKEKDEPFKKRIEQLQEEKEPETVVAKPYASYDAYARKVTVYPFRSGGYNYEV